MIRQYLRFWNRPKERKQRSHGAEGKIPLVLERVCEMAGIHDCLMAVCDLEYPAFMEWVESHKPEKLEIINTGQNMDWLLKHQNMLFPQKSNVAAQWFHMVQHRGRQGIIRHTIWICCY